MRNRVRARVFVRHRHAGQRVLIHGGAGGVGHLAVDYKTERFEDKVHDVDLVFDLIAGDTQERSWAILKDGGTLVSTLAKPSEAKAREHHARATNYVAHPDGAELAEIRGLIRTAK